MRGSIYHPGAGYHDYPPPRNRSDPPRRVCPHCELTAYTLSPTCPVCATRYQPRWRDRVKRLLGR
jgi:uncharacterized paraquat-inducible protein A